MKKLEVFDPPMCCSTGMCGPSVDPKLAQFAADLEWLAGQGVSVQRFGLTHEPEAYAANELLRNSLAERGADCLPIILADGQIASSGVYPQRDELAKIAGLEAAQEAPALSPRDLPQGGCCGQDSGTSCCGG